MSSARALGRRRRVVVVERVRAATGDRPCSPPRRTRVDGRRRRPRAGKGSTCPWRAWGRSRVAQTSPGVEIAVGLEHRHAHSFMPELDRPVERGGAAIAQRAGVDDQAAVPRPDRLGDETSSGSGAAISSGACALDGRLHRGRGVDHCHVDPVAQLLELDQGALAQAVVRGDQEEDAAGRGGGGHPP